MPGEVFLVGHFFIQLYSIGMVGQDFLFVKFLGINLVPTVDDVSQHKGYEE